MSSEFAPALPFHEVDDHATLGSILLFAANRYGNRHALFFEEQWVTYDELNEASARFADGITRLGIHPGDRVVLHIPNSLDWIIAYYGLAKAGAVIVPLDFMLTPDEIIFVVNDCEAKACITGVPDPRMLERIRNETALSQLILSDEVVNPPDAIRQSDVVASGTGEFQPIPVDVDSLASIAYTAGTTGKPKGVMLTHRNILSSALLTAEAHQRGPDDVFLSALPCTHVYGNSIIHASIWVGARFVLLRRFDAETTLASIARHRVTMFEGVPTMFLRILAHSRREKHDLSSLTRCTVGGQSMPVEKIGEVERLTGAKLLELWGMTELGGPAITHLASNPGPDGSIGVPLPSVEVSLRGDEFELDRTQRFAAELCLRGPLVMQGYLNRPDLSRETIDEDGWLHTGDLATIDEKGNVYIVGRTKDIIITAGYNIYPAEVERVICQHPAVAMAAIGRAADAEKGEITVAYVVLKPGHSALAGEIEQTVRDKLAPYKAPRRVIFVRELPISATGKILRHRLHEAKPIEENMTTDTERLFKFVKTEIVGHTGVVTMYGPKGVNALNEDMITEIADALHSFDRNPAVRCMVLRAGTARYFSVGADIEEMSSRTSISAFEEDFFTLGWARISQCRKPLIAAVSGLALGGGCELALMCDLIVASETAEFGLPEVRLGIFPGAGGTQRLIRQIGKSKAMEIILTGQTNLSASEALTSGLVARVVPEDQIYECAFDIAQKIANNSTLVVRMAKESINRAYESSLAEGLLFERRLFYASLASEDKSEGTKAFLERRPPVFSDR